MLAHHIDLTAEVESEKSRRGVDVDVAVRDLIEWLTTEALEYPLHRVGLDLHTRLMQLGVLLIGVWLAHRLPSFIPERLQRGRGWYLYRGRMSAPVRSRFGIAHIARPEYLLVHGDGPPKVAPYDRRIGLAAGRMSLGVHLVVGSLIGRMTFQEAHDVMTEFGVYAPATRSMHGIVDGLGVIASGFMETLPAPDDDGEILVIEVDHKGAPHMSPEEHRKRRRKHKKRGKISKRESKRIRRIVRLQGRERKKTGDKAKNARMASIGTVYTLRQLEDGSVEGPIHRRVFGTFKGPRALFKTLLREAKKRGYGVKETLFVADGEARIWKLQKEFFPLATPCLDWYHLAEYIWTAIGAVHDGNTKAARAKRKAWVRERQDELRANDVDAVLTALAELHGKIGKSAAGKSRRKKVTKAITYINNHRDLMPYKELLARNLVIASGNIEGAAKYIGARLDGSGMRWSKERSEHVLALRCVLASDEWKGFAEAVVAIHEQRDDWVVDRVTPATVMTPHKAARKAA